MPTLEHARRALVLVIVGQLLVAMNMSAAGVAAANHGRKKHARGGPSTFTFYMHNEVYSAAANNTGYTSVYSGGPPDLGLANPTEFGVRSTFEMPVTARAARGSSRIGTARGMWLFDGHARLVLLHVFTATIASGPHTGTLAILGQEDESLAARVLVVVGGTGDFLAARGAATSRLVALNSTLPATWTLSFRLRLYY
jgi:hypothetical protein